MLGAMRLACFMLVLLVGCTSTRDDETVTCTPGTNLLIGCDGVDLGSCDGDPVLRVCNGTLDPAMCRAATDGFAEADDDVGRCPRLVVECPSSGVVTVTTRSFVRMEGYVCDWRVADFTGTPPPRPTDAGGMMTTDPDAGPGGPSVPDAGPGGPSVPDAGPGSPAPPG